MRTRALFVVGLAFVLFASWGLIQLTKPVATGENADFTVIGTMQSRNRIVTVMTGPEGIVYSIATKDGHSLFENISPEKLKAQAPVLHDFIERGLAGDARLLRDRLPIGAPWIDASIR